jgi:hypothetical protein
VKRFLLILLISIYTSATFGMRVKSFYCCNQLKSTTLTLSYTAKEKCNTKGMKGGCCKTRFHYYKVKDTHLVADSVKIPAKSFIDFFNTPVTTQPASWVSLSALIPAYSNAPPWRNERPIYLFNCVYRI